MFLFSSVKMAGQTIKRSVQTFHLAHALSELFKTYECTGGPTPQVEAALNAAIDRSLTGVREPRSRLQGRLYTLLRAKDMHRFVVEEAALVPVKLKLLEHGLFYRGLDERWAAIRDLLVSSIDMICRVSISGVVSNYELYKQQVSEPSGSLGRLLTTAALLNFDVDEEQPPTNLRLRFHKGRFPEHSWELEGLTATSAAADSARSWRPQNPLCRWEYLGADLLHALYRRQNSASAWDGVARAEARAEASTEESSPAQALPPVADGEVYCDLGRGGEGQAQADQMELFPLHPRTFLPELQRQIHHSHGAEGVRLFVLLFERLGKSPCGAFLSLDMAEVVNHSGDKPVSAAKLRQRCKKLMAILEYLAQLRLTRIDAIDGEGTCQQSNLITILDVTNPHEPGTAVGKDAIPSQVRLLVDPVFYLHAEGALDLPYRDLPEPLLSASAKDHPYALGLLVYLRQAWKEDWENGEGIIQTSARRIFADAGFGLKDSARYRSIEAMKRDLAWLKENNWLEAWRMTRSASREALDDIYRLEAPNRKGNAEPRRAPVRGDASVSA